MSTHPNVILMAVLEPDDLSRKTMRSILAESGDDDSGDVEIGSVKYHSIVMEDDYDKGFQIAAKKGSLVFFNMVTYGYGETISWEELEKYKSELSKWSTGVCERHHCTCEIAITANYW